MSEVHEPRWLRIVAFGSVLTLAGFGAVGLLLADFGWYEPALVLVLGAAASAGLLWLATPLLKAGRAATASSRAGAWFALTISAGYAIWNGVNASEHVQINRDGGTYLNAGKWIATHGTLEVHPYVGAFAGTTRVVATSTGMSRHGDHLEFGVSHLLSAILAEAQNLGGDHLMFLAVPILSGLALLVFYLLAHKLLHHPFAALAAVVSLALLLPQISFSRDSMTEVPLQVLLFTAVLLYADRHTLRDFGTAFCAGLLLGLAAAMHVAGVVFLVGVPAVCATWLVRAKAAEHPILREGFLWTGLGIGVGVLLGLLDLIRTSHRYLSLVDADLERLFAAVLVVTALVVALVRMRSRDPQLLERRHRSRQRAGDIAGALVLLGGFGAWLIRPIVQTSHGAPSTFIARVQRLNHLRVHPAKRYTEFSVQWISWYLGPLTIIIAIVAAAALVRALVQGRLRIPNRIPALILGPGAVLYIWNPNVYPDQIWAARRFVPAVFPGVILLTFGVLCVLARDRDRSYASERRFGAVLLTLVTITFPLYTIHGVTQMTEQRGLLAEYKSTCRLVGANGAVVVLQEAKATAYLNAPQTLRSFCDVPVAVMRGRPNRTALRTLATKWAQQRKRLFVVAQYPLTIQRTFPGAHLLYTPVGENQHLLEVTLTRSPRAYNAELLQLTVARVPLLN